LIAYKRFTLRKYNIARELKVTKSDAARTSLLD
jgi:hypothetical protein